MNISSNKSFLWKFLAVVCQVIVGTILGALVGLVLGWVEGRGTQAVPFMAYAGGAVALCLYLGGPVRLYFVERKK